MGQGTGQDREASTETGSDFTSREEENGGLGPASTLQSLCITELCITDLCITERLAFCVCEMGITLPMSIVTED